MTNCSFAECDQVLIRVRFLVECCDLCDLRVEKVSKDLCGGVWKISWKMEDGTERRWKRDDADVWNVSPCA